jgi:N utilization substance protein B
MQDTPHAVVFDEAIELARRYGTGDSSAFVNGVLDRLFLESGIKKESAGPSLPTTLPEGEGNLELTPDA